MDSIQAYNFLVRAGIVRPQSRTLYGSEAEQTLTMLRLIDPVASTNNQHSWTDDYIVGNLHYEVHSFDDGSKIIEEININEHF